MEIVDNVLSEKTFNNIVNYTCNNNDFPWNLVQNGVSIPGDGKYQFIHEFKSETGVMSPYNYLLRNLYLRLGVNTLWRCKMNLKIKTKKTHVFYPFHTDFTTLQVPFTTVVFYLNTNNGYTLFEDGTKVDSVANRMVMFNGNTKHTSASHTEGDRFRFVLNINFS